MFNSAAGEGMCLSQRRLPGGGDVCAGLESAVRKGIPGRGGSPIKGTIYGICWFFFVHPGAIFLFLITPWHSPSSIESSLGGAVSQRTRDPSPQQMSHRRPVEFSYPGIDSLAQLLQRRKVVMQSPKRKFIVPTWIPDLFWFSIFSCLML